MIEVDLIKKHGKKALGMEEHGHRKQTWRQRLPEILLEIGIIVFAVTLSIQLHAWHERALDREAERHFLVGLRTDLQNDLRELRNDSISYVRTKRNFKYLLSINPATTHLDSIKRRTFGLYNRTNLVPNISRFEGFKSSGRLTVIQDDELLNAILDYYQEMIPILLSLTNDFTAYKVERIQTYLEDHVTYSDSNLPSIISSDRMKRSLSKENQITEIIEKYHEVMQESRDIIKMIDKSLGAK